MVTIVMIMMNKYLHFINLCGPGPSPVKRGF